MKATTRAKTMKTRTMALSKFGLYHLIQMNVSYIAFFMVIFFSFNVVGPIFNAMAEGAAMNPDSGSDGEGEMMFDDDEAAESAVRLLLQRVPMVAGELLFTTSFRLYSFVVCHR